MAAKIKVGIIGGTGLDNPDILKNRKEKKVSTIFGDPSDVLIFGDIEGVPCILLARHGRNHTIMPSNVNFRANIWALKEQGCTHILVSTACGSLQEDIRPGDVVIVDNFIDRTQKRFSTFYDGEQNHPKGVLHLPMEPPFCEQLRQLLIKTAGEVGIPVHKSGTVVAIEGPRYSSRAESLVYQQWGAHLVNMTIVPEVVLAKEAGLCYASIAMATDYDCWRESEPSVCVNEVMDTFQQNMMKVQKIILGVVPAIGKEDWTETINNLQKLIRDNTMIEEGCKCDEK